MDAIVLVDCYVEVDETDISDHCSSMTVHAKFAEVDSTTFGATSESQTHGLRQDSFDCDIFVDEGAAEVSNILWPLFVNKSTFKVAVRQLDAPIATDNPEFSAYCKIFDMVPLGGKVGEASTTTINFKAQTPILKDTSPTTAY